MPKRPSSNRATVERKIYFYRVNVGTDDGGRALPFAPKPVLTHLANLPFTVGRRYWEERDGNLTGCWIDQPASHAKLRLGHIRRSSLPLVERA
jgi:hypothetical protein